MKIAALVKDGLLCGPKECEQIKLYAMAKGALQSAEIIYAPAGFDCVLVRLAEEEATVLLAAEFDPEERTAAGQQGLSLFAKGKVSPGAALVDLLEEKLIADPDACGGSGVCSSCAGCH